MNSKSIYGITELLSNQRLTSYMGKTIKTPESVLTRYKYNKNLSKSFYPLLCCFEVSIRNVISITQGERLSNPDWLTQENGNYLQGDLLDKLNKAKEDLGKKSKDINQSNIIASLTFGFWVKLYDKCYDSQNFSVVKKQFPYAKGIALAQIRKDFNEIKDFRNRVFHYEPIWHWKKDDLFSYVLRIDDYLKWINPELHKTFDKDVIQSLKDLINDQEKYLR